MVSPAVSHRLFVAGSSGWTAADLDDPPIAKLWHEGNFELIEGVLTRMAAAYYDGQKRLRRLTTLVEKHLESQGRNEQFAFEVDLELSNLRVPKADAILLTPDDERLQREAHQQRGQPEIEFGRILVPPTLLIESVSIGHERHDEVLKRGWYADSGIQNYWIFNPFAKSLTCLVLDRSSYRADQSGKETDEVRPSLFPGLVIPLSRVW